MLRFALACIHKKNRKAPPKVQEKRKPPEFQEDDEVIISEPTDTDLLKEYILRNPVHRESKATIQMAMSGVNTYRIYRLNRGMMHKEGGWPKDVAPTNPESVMRFKKKIEKSECYRNEVVDKAYDIVPCLVQNNTMNIYEHYFEDLEPPPLFETPEHKTVNVYRDVRPQHRRVNHFSWSPDRGSKLAVSHCDIEFLRIFGNKRQTNSESFIWDVEKPNTPMIRLGALHPMMCLEFSTKDTNILISGLTSGQVALWDSRIPKGPTMINERSIGHKDCVNSVLWVNSKTSTEFFSGSNDGQVIWWDVRNFKEPLNVLYMDPHRTDEQNLSRSLSVSKLEYETTIPTRFMCATHQGYIFSCNKKGKVPTEVINHKLKCHVGPVRALVRNAFYVKSFLTVGDWSGRIWVEECREHCVLSLGEKKTMVTDGAWSTTKPSVVFISSEDGVLQCYDIIKKLKQPMLNIKVCDVPISTIRPHENGKLIAVGNTIGVTQLIEISEDMQISNKNDKLALTSMFERETKRAKILETKLREQKIKFALKSMRFFENDEHLQQMTQKNLEDFVACQLIEKDLFKCVEQEKINRIVAQKKLYQKLESSMDDID